jgi:predicted RNA polymerase sigma factor
MGQRISRARRMVSGQPFAQPGDVAVVLRVQAALARDQRGEYQIQAAIAALHDDARSAGETDWPQILAWYNELLGLTGNPVAALSRAIAVGEVDGPLAGLSAVEELATRLGHHHRLDAVRARLHEQAGHLGIAAEHYARAAAQSRNTAERDYLTKQAARLRHRSPSRATSADAAPNDRS